MGVIAVMISSSWFIRKYLIQYNTISKYQILITLAISNKFNPYVKRNS